jgi:hypothetical protein
MEHKQVIVLRKDLNMRKGKMVAQGAHASMRAILNGARREGDVLIIPLDARNEPWLCGRFKKICVSVNSEHQELMRQTGHGREAQYPGFSSEPLDAFRHVAHDLEKFGGDFMFGSGESIVSAKKASLEHPSIQGFGRLP